MAQKIKQLTAKEKTYIADRVENEGFDYGMMNFMGDIKNPHFKELLAKYEAIRQELGDFCSLEDF